MIHITGDTHGGEDIRKLTSRNFAAGQTLNRDDYVIIAGDFGFIWDGGRRDTKWLDWFGRKNFTTLFIDGNHENYDLLRQYPVSDWNGGKARFIRDNVIYLERGQVFTISGLKFFTFGGAKSLDTFFRIEGITWWKSETPSEEEYAEGLRNLEAAGWKVDYIITHTCPASVCEKVIQKYKKMQRVTELETYLESINKKTAFKKWYFGHFHIDESVTLWHQAVYQKVYPLPVLKQI